MTGTLPLIVDVKRGSTEDGPGIRTTVFFKGCPLSCVWCHNPETIDPYMEIGFYPKNCIGCGECEKTCPEGAVILEAPGRIVRSKCSRCGECADACPSRALRNIGESYKIQELVDLIMRDRIFYEVSGGGVTLCGGEPALWPEYAGNLLREIKSNGIHTILQTCGYFNFSTFDKKMRPWLDLVMFDIKIMDGADHARYTGKSNQLILHNFARLLDCGVEVIARVPQVPGYTASPENLAQISRFLELHEVSRYEVLPYNPLGISKWSSLGKVKPDVLT